MTDNTLFIDDFAGYTDPYLHPDRWFRRPARGGSTTVTFGAMGIDGQDSLSVTGGGSSSISNFSNMHVATFAPTSALAGSFFARFDVARGSPGSNLFPRFVSILLDGQAELHEGSGAKCAAIFAISMTSSGAVVVSSLLNSASAPSRYVGLGSSGATVRFTSGIELVPGVLHHFEFLAETDGATATIKLLVDGAFAGEGSVNLPAGPGVDLTKFGGVALSPVNSDGATHFSNFILYDDSDPDGDYRYPMGPMRFWNLQSTDPELRDGGGGHPLTVGGVVSSFDDMPAGGDFISAYVIPTIDAGAEAGHVSVRVGATTGLSFSPWQKIKVNGAPASQPFKLQGVDGVSELNETVFVIKRRTEL